MSDNFEDAANSILTFLHLCEEEKEHRLMVPLRSMDGAIPMNMPQIMAKPTDGLLIPVNDGKPAIWPANVCTVIHHGADQPFPDHDRWPVGTLQFQRTRTINRQEARKLGADKFSQLMVMDEVSTALPDGKAQSAKAPFALIGGRWQGAAANQIKGGHYNTGQYVETRLGHSLMVRYEWTVWVGYEAGPRIRFLSDPTGAREVFRLRDLPAGRERRAALRNWVSGHSRKRRDDEEARTWVRKHLRGATDFVWNGMRCRIQPPDYDVEQLARHPSFAASAPASSA